MSQTKFTKGEWVANFPHVEAKGRLISDCGISNYEDHEEEKANANLIAAAPDMYRLLEACEKTFGSLYPSEVKHVQPEHYSEFKAVHHLIGSIQNSLSKARGE